MKNYPRLWAALVALALLGGCAQTYSETDLARAREEAYSSGYQAGLSDAGEQAPAEDRYQEGFADGRSEGYALGLEEGQQVVLTSAGDSYQQGYEAGYASGYAKQDQEGQAARTQYIAAIQPEKPGAQSSKTPESAEPSGQTAPPAESEDPSGEIVYVTKSGAKYHRGSCSHLSKSRIEKTLAEAKAAGYTPCGSCKPPE